MAGPGAGPGGQAIYYDIIGDAAHIPDIHPVTDFPVTADYQVTNLSELNSALSSASAGDTIELAPGNYGAWYPQKINTTTEANHDANKIRIFCRNSPFLNSDANSAVFANIEPDNTPGCTGLSIENVKLADFRAEGSNIGFIDLVGCLSELWRLTHSTGRMRALHCVFDHGFAQSDGNGSTSNMNYVDCEVYLQNVIFCRAGGDNIQIQYTDTNGKIFLHDFAIWDQYVNNSAAHPDLLQTNDGRSVDIRRGIAWQEPGLSGNKGAQGIFLAGGVHVDSVVEDVFVRCDLARKISCTSYTGSVSNCCTVGFIYAGVAEGTSAAVDLNNCVMAGYSDNGGAYSISPDDPGQNNTQYGSGNEDTVFVNTSGDYRSPYDFLPVTSRDNGGVDFLTALQTKWSGSGGPAEMPADGQVTFSVTVS